MSTKQKKDSFRSLLESHVFFIRLIKKSKGAIIRPAVPLPRFIQFKSGNRAVLAVNSCKTKKKTSEPASQPVSQPASQPASQPGVKITLALFSKFLKFSKN